MEMNKFSLNCFPGETISKQMFMSRSCNETLLVIRAQTLMFLYSLLSKMYWLFVLRCQWSEKSTEKSGNLSLEKYGKCVGTL